MEVGWVASDIYLLTNRISKSIEVMTLLANKMPDNIDIALHLTYLLRLDNQASKAIEILHHFEDQGKEKIGYLLEEIRIARYFHQITKVEDLFEKALKKFPNNSSLQMEFARFQADYYRNVELADKYFVKALKFNRSAENLTNYGYFNFATKCDEEEADKNFQEALGLKNEFWVKAGYAYFLMHSKKNLDKGAKIFESLPNAALKNPTVLEFMIFYHLRHTKNSEKLGKLEKYGSQNYPNNDSIILALADIYEELNDIDLSIELVQKSISIYEFRSFVSIRMGFLLLKKGEAVKSEASFRKAVEYEPHDANNHANMAYILIINEKEDEANTHINNALSLVQKGQEIVALETWFYIYITSKSDVKIADAKLKLNSFIDKGLRTAMNLERVIEKYKDSTFVIGDEVQQYCKHISC